MNPAAPGSPAPLPSPPPYSAPRHPSLSSLSCPSVHTGHSSQTGLNWTSPPYRPSSTLVCSPDVGSSDPGFLFGSRPQPRGDPAAPITPPPGLVSIVMLSPDLRPFPAPSRCSEDTCLDLECSVCFSQFNNIFRCPKMLQCKHTFCLECLARINVKSADPNAIQCPLCRSLTPLPTLGLPKLVTDSDVLSCLPGAMQRVYSVRFHRSKGKLQVKRSSEGQRWWGRRSLASLRSLNRSLNVGLPSPPVRGDTEVGGVLFRLTGRPACRAFLLTSVVMMMVLLTGIVVFLLTFYDDEDD